MREGQKRRKEEWDGGQTGTKGRNREKSRS